MTDAVQQQGLFVEGPSGGALERFFEWKDGDLAAVWAQEPGHIAIHRNFDVTGLKIGTKVREGAAFHALASDRAALIEWGKRYRLTPRWLQAPKLRGIFRGLWHYDVFGWGARELLARGGFERGKAAPPEERGDGR